MRKLSFLHTSSGTAPRGYLLVRNFSLQPWLFEDCDWAGNGDLGSRLSRQSTSGGHRPCGKDSVALAVTFYSCGSRLGVLTAGLQGTLKGNCFKYSLCHQAGASLTSSFHILVGDGEFSTEVTRSDFGTRRLGFKSCLLPSSCVTLQTTFPLILAPIFSLEGSIS